MPPMHWSGRMTDLEAMLAPALTTVAANERALLEEARFPVELQSLALVALSRHDSVLSGAIQPPWARLPLLACASATARSPLAAIPLAVAIEVQAAAYSLLDDLEDGDVTEVERQSGRAVTLNVTTTLLGLAQRALLGVPVHAAMVMAEGWLGACGGQHRDLTLESDRPDPLTEVVLASEGKTAGVTAAALEAGAWLGGANADLCVRYRYFGRAVGIAGQLANDIVGLHPRCDGITDISRGRLTLPLLFTLGSGAVPALRACLEIARSGNPVPPILHAQALQELEEVGAHRYVWALLQIARREAADILAEIACYRPVRGVLDVLLPHAVAVAGTDC